MRILINCSNLSGGGGGQVADSVCSYLNVFPQHHFVVVCSCALKDISSKVSGYNNVECLFFNYPKRDYKSLITGRNDYLDGVVARKQIDCVLTVFGPMKWLPRCPHVCGFALAQLVIPESPYFQQMTIIQRIKSNISICLDSFLFRRGTRHLYSENPFISKRVELKFRGSEVRTITNNYNQIFDNRILEKYIELDSFDGISILTLASPYPHKNLSLSIGIARYLRKHYPDFRFRFVLSINKEDLPLFEKSLEESFVFLGKVAIEECPSLYEQCDIAFVPTLIECFTAMYAEAMRMGVPIVTTDLPFARGLCQDAAVYYQALSAEKAAEIIYDLSTNEALRESLVKNGRKRLQEFDSSEQRARKLIRYCEDICL